MHVRTILDRRHLPDGVGIFRCPSCGERLMRTDRGADCFRCTASYDYVDGGTLDLRLKSPRYYPVAFVVGAISTFSRMPEWRPVQTSVSRVGLRRRRTPNHLTNAILDRFPAAQSQSSIALDLGCGTGPHRAVCERAGFQWVGLDCAERVPIWEDGHALPFADDSFEFVFTIAVLEHIRYPFVVLQEVNGVRKPGGTLIGTVAFLEPFHAQSFYHHCDLGTLNLLAHSGLSALEVAPHADWTARTAHARVGLFPSHVAQTLATCNPSH